MRSTTTRETPLVMIGPRNRDCEKRDDDVSLTVTVECAAVIRAIWRNRSPANFGAPELITNRVLPEDISNERQPAWALRDRSTESGRPVSTMTTVFSIDRRS
ncbi:hypothetical protein D3C87_1870040 [compost metagenome]